MSSQEASSKQRRSNIANRRLHPSPSMREVGLLAAADASVAGDDAWIAVPGDRVPPLERAVPQAALRSRRTGTSVWGRFQAIGWCRDSVIGPLL